MNEVRFNKVLVVLNAILPLGLLGYDALRGQLGANPIEFFLRTTGVLTLIFLIITLTITPLRKLFRWNSVIKYRRMLGLFAFFYGLLHLTTYSVFDKGLDLKLIGSDVIQRPFIALGMTAFMMLIPLAVTSTNGWIKRLGGKRWARLHMLVYPIAILGVIHFWMIVKSDVFYPAVFGSILAILLGFRLMPKLTAGTDARDAKKVRPI